MQDDSVALTGALMLVLHSRFPSWAAWPTTATETLALVGAHKTQAYELRRRVEELLSGVLGRPGRPAKQPTGPFEPAQAASEAVIDHLSRTLFGDGERRTYTGEFRRFVVGLIDPGQCGEGPSVAELARVTRVPLGTLKDWLRSPATAAGKPSSLSQTGGEEAGQPATSERARIAAVAQDRPQPSGATTPSEATSGAERSQPVSANSPVHPAGSAKNPSDEIVVNSHLRLIVEQWMRWKGPFDAFCRMLRTEHRIPYQDTFVGDFLQSAGLRHRRRRIPVEAPWSSDTFRRLFPGAQWLGDGTSIAVHWEDHVFVFNVEAVLDVGSNAVLGFKATDSEDEEAILQAFQAGLETTGGSGPLALTLDNRPSNHSEDVVSAIEAEGTMVLAATPGRGQAKAPLEGAFGLFRQSLPAVVLTGQTAREIARCALILILLAWFRGRNGRPRERFAGLSPVQFYAWAQANLTPEQVQAAREWFAELQRRQDRFRRTREARRDPVRIQLLAQGLAELGIPDENRRLAIALAYYSRDAIIRGLATFAAKKEKGTLPEGADPIVPD